MADFQFFRDFIFTNGSAKSSAVQSVAQFLRVKFHEWAISAKFVEFTYLEKNQLYGSFGLTSWNHPMDVHVVTEAFHCSSQLQDYVTWLANCTIKDT